MADLIERADAINAIRYVTDSPNYSKTLGELLHIPSVEQTENCSEKPNNSKERSECMSIDKPNCFQPRQADIPQPDCPWK